MKELIGRIDKRVNTEALRVGAYDGELMTLLSQCKAALSQKQEAVGVVVEANDGTLVAIASVKAGALKSGDTLYTAPPSTAQEDSPTKGMSLGERIAHVGGRENAAGYTEFGSVMAVKALIDHVLRDIDRPSQPTAQDVVSDFEEAWKKRPWIIGDTSDKEDALFWWKASKDKYAKPLDGVDSKSQPTAQDGMVPQSVEDALEHELNMIEMTLSQFDTPAAAINELISWHVAVAEDPKVNGGKVLVPVEPTRAMIAETIDKVFDGSIEDAGIIEEIYSAMLKAASKGE